VPIESSACACTALEEIELNARSPRVTSDCTPFHSGGRLLVCHTCGTAQAPSVLEELVEIYSNYRAFQQYGGPELQGVDAASGELRAPAAGSSSIGWPRWPNSLSAARFLDGEPRVHGEEGECRCGEADHVTAG